MYILDKLKGFLQKKEVNSILRKAEIGTHTGLFLISVMNNAKTVERIKEMIEWLSKEGEIYYLCINQRFITFATSKKYTNYAKSLFEGYTLFTEEGVASVFLKANSKVRYTKGYTAELFKLFLKNDINIYGSFPSGDDDGFIIKEKDIYTIIEELRKI